MKISTVRSLLILFDLVLLGAIVGVVYLGLQERPKRKQRRQDFQKHVNRRLAEVKPEANATKVDLTYAGIGKMSMGPPPPEDKVPTEDTNPKPVAGKARPLADLVELVGTEVHSGEGASPSFILYTLKSEGGGRPVPAVPDPKDARSRGGRGGRGNRNGNRNPARNVRRAPTGPVGPTQNIYKVFEGYVIEFSEHEVATVKEVRSTEVIFDYDKRDVVVKVPPKRLGTGSSGSTSTAEATGPISPDPGTWIAWVPSKPREIKITPMGMRAFGDKGEKALDGVRWGTERYKDGKDAVRLAKIPKNSALAKAGAQEGDLLISINGKRVSSKAGAVAYVRANPDLPAYIVEFRRQGRQYKRTVHPPRAGGR